MNCISSEQEKISPKVNNIRKSRWVYLSNFSIYSYIYAIEKPAFKEKQFSRVFYEIKLLYFHNFGHKCSSNANDENSIKVCSIRDPATDFTFSYTDLKQTECYNL